MSTYCVCPTLADSYCIQQIGRTDSKHILRAYRMPGHVHLGPSNMVGRCGRNHQCKEQEMEEGVTQGTKD